VTYKLQQEISYAINAVRL